MIDLVKITPENLAKEHICCALAGAKDCQVLSKKAWLKERLAEGLVFLKGDVRGKCFIEYLPAEFAWAPVEADGYTFIDCLWVAGRFAGQGHSNLLLKECIRDSREQGKKGLVILSSPKKRSFLSDPTYLRHKGFAVADTAPPYFELLYLPFDGRAEPPRFGPSAKGGAQGPAADGFVLYYTNQCPFPAKYAPPIEGMARDRAVPFRSVHLTTREQARQAPTPFPTYSLFYNGAFVTHEILSEKKFEKLLLERGL